MSNDSKNQNSSQALIMKIGSYQLENLLNQRTRFVYLDLRSGDVDRTHPLLQTSVPTEESQVLGQVQQMAPNLDFPVVLLCENGLASERAAQVVDAAGYRNIFVVRGGFQGL